MTKEVYRYPWSYAKDHGEETQYRESKKANITCANAIGKVISDKVTPAKYGTYFDSVEAANALLSEFGMDRVSYVLANTIRHADWDARYAQNRTWAAQIPVFADESYGMDATRQYIICGSHPVYISALAMEIAKRQVNN